MWHVDSYLLLDDWLSSESVIVKSCQHVWINSRTKLGRLPGLQHAACFLVWTGTCTQYTQTMPGFSTTALHAIIMRAADVCNKQAHDEIMYCTISTVMGSYIIWRTLPLFWADNAAPTVCVPHTVHALTSIRLSAHHRPCTDKPEMGYSIYIIVFRAV